MIFGLVTIVAGYAVLYWGIHHFPQYKDSQRYSLWELLGFGTLFKNLSLPHGWPTKFKTS